MDNITVLIPIAPIVSNPSSEVLDMTLKSIRERLPTSEIILMFDAIPAWQEELRPAYEEFTKNMLWKSEHELKNVTPIVFDHHSHQSMMTKRALEIVKTSLILWSEQDTPLHNEIPFNKLAPVVEDGYANVIRFHHEAQIHPEHKSLMVDTKPIKILGQPFLRTRQWSGRPHLASTAFYQDLANRYFHEPMFIEHILYGPVSNEDFNNWRLHMYAPTGTLVRSLHTDGRRYGAKEYDPSVS